jgi:heterodisulfide reductase subunit A2
MGQNKPKGSVMVVGGGIAGIQAALSLADAGYGVYLVERKAALGGMIPDLHRTYPLCACCKLNPRIAACEQNPNIEVMPNTSVEAVSGDLGSFKVSLNAEGENRNLEVGAVILAAGIETFDPSGHQDYAYGRFPNVITSVEYERMQKPQGSDAGIIKRPSDGKTPERIAWLQCVGSRDINQCDAPYCSSVCCMFALKEAVNTKDFSEDIDTTIFYMDMRTHGKGFEDYLNNAVEREVNLIRSRVHTVDRAPGTEDLKINYADESGKLIEEIYDMVVLSVGLRPSGEAVELAEKMGINLSEDGFVASLAFEPVSTNRAGFFVCGGLSGPFDIGQSVAQAAASVSEVASCLSPAPFSPPVEYPKPSKPGKKAKILMAYSLCPGMAGDMGAGIEEYGKTLPGVLQVLKLDNDIMAGLRDGLKESGADRLVFASCTPVVHEPLIREALRQSGINPYLYETVDLRVIDPETASAEVRDRIRMGAARAGLMSAAPVRDVPVKKRALVVGGGVSGLESALALSNEGTPVTLVEMEKELGGHGRHVRATWQGYDAQEYLKGLIASVKKDKNITVMTKTTVKANRGFAGNFVTTLIKGKGKPKDVSHGVTILAPGGDPVKPSEYLYGLNENVYLWSELSEKMIRKPSAVAGADTAVFIQCVGSREPDCPHCSNLCCSFAVRTAVDLKEKNPDMNIYILYREMRTFGERENIYREARNKGVVFIRYDLENKPVVEAADHRLKVTVHDAVLDRPLMIEADFISLQSAIVGTANQELADIFGVNLDASGFLAESPEKLKPMDTSIPGVYMAGLGAYPKDTGESITQAKAAAARALEILSQDKVQVGGLVAEVSEDKCAVCCTCVRTCPFNVPVIDPDRGAAYIDPGMCQGCGMCVAECPGKAINMAACSDQMLTQIPSIVLAAQ